MAKANVIVHKESTYWEADILADAFAACFSELGFEGKAWVGEAPNPKKSSHEDIHMLIDFPAFRLMGKGWNNCQRRAIVFWNATRFHDSRENRRRWGAKHWKSNVGDLDKIVDFIFDYDRHNCAVEYDRPAPAVPCEIGYHPLFETKEEGPALHDVCFLGWVYEGGRRDKILRRLEEEHSVVVCRRMKGRRRDHTEPHKYVDREATRQALRCRLFLNIQTDTENPTFTSNRVIQFGLSNGRCVLSEPIPLAPPELKDGEHWLCRPVEEWPRVVAELLADNRRRISLAAGGKRFISSSYLLFDHLKSALETAGLT